MVEMPMLAHPDILSRLKEACPACVQGTAAGSPACLHQPPCNASRPSRWLHHRCKVVSI